MEPFYYSKMNKMQQATYHAICQGVLRMEKEIQVPRMSGEELYNVFFRMRLDHPEIFSGNGFKYRYYQESPNIQFLPEYLFDRAKVKRTSEGNEIQGRETCTTGAEIIRIRERKNTFMISFARM